MEYRIENNGPAIALITTDFVKCVIPVGKSVSLEVSRDQLNALKAAAKKLPNITFTKVS